MTQRQIYGSTAYCCCVILFSHTIQKRQKQTKLGSTAVPANDWDESTVGLLIVGSRAFLTYSKQKQKTTLWVYLSIYRTYDGNNYNTTHVALVHLDFSYVRTRYSSNTKKLHLWETRCFIWLSHTISSQHCKKIFSLVGGETNP